MFIEKLLQLMAEKKASDIFISSGSPISIKINGTIMPVNPAPMDPEQTKKIIYEMLTPEQIEIFAKTQELNFSKPMPGLGNFRVNCFWQKGSIGCVIRYVTADIPKMNDLSLPQVLSSLIMEKRGLVLVVGLSPLLAALRACALPHHQPARRLAAHGSVSRGAAFRGTV